MKLTVPKQQQQQVSRLKQQYRVPLATKRHILSSLVGLANETAHNNCAFNALLQIFAAVPGLRAMWLATDGDRVGDLLVLATKEQLQQLMLAQQGGKRGTQVCAGEPAAGEAATEKPLDTESIRQALAIMYPNCFEGRMLCVKELLWFFLRHLDVATLAVEAEQDRMLTLKRGSSSSINSSSYPCFPESPTSRLLKSKLLDHVSSLGISARCLKCKQCCGKWQSSLHIPLEELIKLRGQQGLMVGKELINYGLQLAKCCDKPERGNGSWQLLQAPEVLMMDLEAPPKAAAFNAVTVVPKELLLPFPEAAGATQPRYQLQGMVLYGAKHFTAAVLHQVAGQSTVKEWHTADDTIFKFVGNWQALVTKCLAGQNHPRLLFYQRVA
jgi:hypothetical protein